jgi:hypothetical protein
MSMQKSLMQVSLFLLFLIFFLAGCRQEAIPQPTPQPVLKPERVIFDTDVGGDVDDAGALAVLHALADKGEIELLAMGVVIGHEAAVPYVHAVNTWYGRPFLPIGTIKDKAPYARDEYMVPVVAAYPYTLTSEAAPDVVKLYRQVLARQPDRSVTLIAVGPATNIYRLLMSKADEHSPLTGVELMRRKIKLYAAGGNGGGGLPKGRCGFNYYMDLASARGELELLPSAFPTVYAGGSGLKLEVGAVLRQARPDHIIRRSYEAYYKGEAQNRFSWDQLRVLYGCRPSARRLWDVSARGSIELGADSVLTYKGTPDRNRAYAYVNDLEAMRAMLTELMMYDPREK